jgi:hypothetical protein
MKQSTKDKIAFLFCPGFFLIFGFGFLLMLVGEDLAYKKYLEKVRREREQKKASVRIRSSY